jgi:hypothetical protein
MDCDAIFITKFESPMCYNNSKTIHEIHMTLYKILIFSTFHILLILVVPWSMIDIATSCHTIMLSCVGCFHPSLLFEEAL